MQHVSSNSRRTPSRGGAFLVLAALGLAGQPGANALESGGSSAPRTAAPSVRLVWHVETRDGEVLETRDASIAINPASVVKVATTLWALERLGPGHRFETRFVARGRLDPSTAVLEGDLLVFGGGDPDFHVDNAFLVGRSLNAAGLKTVNGKLLVDDSFWIGWEGGSDRKTSGPEQRAATMASRLRKAFDPARWDRATGREMTAVAARRQTGSSPEKPPEIVVRSGTGVHRETDTGVGMTLALHRSNPLHRLLDRFNTHSNNDIERLELRLGPPADLASALAIRWGTPESPPTLSTLSGLGSNRMTPRQVVRLLRDLEESCRRLGLVPEDVLPVVGCGPSTLSAFRGIPVASVVAKTGTLVQTDGGMAMLAGIARTIAGDRFFCVAAPESGDKLWAARKAEREWLLDLIARSGGAGERPCDSAMGYSDDEALVLFGPNGAGSGANLNARPEPTPFVVPEL